MNIFVANGISCLWDIPLFYVGWVNFMPVEIRIEDKALTACVSGDIDHHTAAALREEIDQNVQLYNPEKLTLDFSRVSFMDSSGVGLIMGRYKLMKELGGKIGITGTSPASARMIKLAGLGRLEIEGV